MKKLTLLAAAFGMVAAAHAQAPFGLPVKAIGFDANLQHITARLPLAGADLDVGAGMKFDNGADEPFSLSASAFYLMKTNTWGPVSNYVALGGTFGILDKASDKIKLGAFAGLQPELTLMDRFIFSTRFGVGLDVLPEFVLATAGPKDGVSIVGGLNFKLLF